MMDGRGDAAGVPGTKAARRFLAWALIFGSAMAAGGGSAASFEIFGIRLWGEAEPTEPPSPDAQPYSIDVAVTGADEALTERVRAASQLYSEREGDPPPSTAAFLSRTMAEYGRIVGALYGAGHYGPVVTIQVDGRDPKDIPPDADLPNPVPVSISVDPGPPFLFGSVDITGRAPPAVDPDDIVEARPEELGLRPGLPALSGVVLGSERALVEAWREQGYPTARIEKRDALAQHPTRELDVAISVSSGPKAVYAPVRTTGTAAMDPDFVAWMTGLVPGRPYDPDDIERAVRNLRRLQVFASQRIVEGDTVAPDGTLPITVNVAERPLRVFGVGASYSTVDGAGAEAYWQHRNLFGRAERLRLEGRVGGIASVDPSEFTYRAATIFEKPGVITPLTDLAAEFSAERKVLKAYTDNTIRARVGLAHEIFEGLSATIAAGVEWTAVEDDGSTDEFLIASLPGTLTYDGRDDPLDPTRGLRAVLSLEPFYEATFGNPGLVAELEGSGYLSVTGGDRLVLAARAAVGSIIGPPREAFPESRRFFVGGGGSVRGYAYRNIGPRDANGSVTGGMSYVEASLEVRAKVTETIGLVPFIDMGAAFQSSYPDFGEDLRFGAGLGLRYETGLGPIRVDAAVPLNPRDTDPAFAIYIGLGQSF